MSHNYFQNNNQPNSYSLAVTEYDIPPSIINIINSDRLPQSQFLNFHVNSDHFQQNDPSGYSDVYGYSENVNDFSIQNNSDRGLDLPSGLLYDSQAESIAPDDSQNLLQFQSPSGDRHINGEEYEIGDLEKTLLSNFEQMSTLDSELEQSSTGFLSGTNQVPHDIYKCYRVVSAKKQELLDDGGLVSSDIDSRVATNQTSTSSTVRIKSAVSLSSGAISPENWC